MTIPADYLHLRHHAEDLFPGAAIEVAFEGETIHLDVDGHGFTFEIGSDDDCYAFSDGNMHFSIPLMEIDWDF